MHLERQKTFNLYFQDSFYVVDENFELDFLPILFRIPYTFIKIFYTV